MSDCLWHSYRVFRKYKKVVVTVRSVWKGTGPRIPRCIVNDSGVIALNVIDPASLESAAEPPLKLQTTVSFIIFVYNSQFSDILR